LRTRKASPPAVFAQCNVFKISTLDPNPYGAMTSTLDTVQDLYPSRVGERAEMLPRLDPVIHSDAQRRSRGPLSDAQLESYGRQGFLVLPQFFTADEVAV